MNQIKPLLAYKKPKHLSLEQFIDTLKWPLFASPKIDGIRCVIQPNNIPTTRSLKVIPNHYIRSWLKTLPPYLDGELIVGNNFQDCTSGIMTRDGRPDFKYLVFDDASDTRAPFVIRQYNLIQIRKICNPPFLTYVAQQEIHSKEQFYKYEEAILKAGYEGVMLREPLGLYIASGGKENRSNKTRPFLVAIKRFEDSEAKIIGFKEQLENTNEPFLDNNGRQVRSSDKEGMVGKNTLGALTVHDIKNNWVFDIGSGMNDLLRIAIWKNKDYWLGRTIKYKYQNYGIKDGPRIPIYVGERSKDDL